MQTTPLSPHPTGSARDYTPPITEWEARAALEEYLALLQCHVAAELMSIVVTADFQTGFENGFRWRGIEGLRVLMSQRAGFFDQRHTITEVLSLSQSASGDAQARTRLEFFLRRWYAPGTTSEELAGSCLHRWRLRRERGRWRVAAQIVQRLEDLNDNARRLIPGPMWAGP